MALLNYTTQIDAMKTIGEIQRRLAAHGASHVIVGFDGDGRPVTLAFSIATPFGARPFRLPSRCEAVEATLQKQARAGKVPRKLASRDQAIRVAWRILKDWVEAQLAIVESGMVTAEEVFFPYLLGKGDRTAFEIAKDQQLALEGHR
jgi:hypothetical protein